MQLNRSCAHIMSTGSTCGAYALRNSELCYWHHKAREARIERKRLNRSQHVKTSGLVLPLLEDANSIQLAIQMVAQAVADRRISRSESGALLYSFQLAMTNLKDVERPAKIYTRTMLVIPTDGDEQEDLVLEEMEIPRDSDPEFDDDDDDDDDESNDDTEDDDKEDNDGEGDDNDDADNENEEDKSKESEDDEEDNPVNQEEVDYAVAWVNKNMGKLKRLGVMPPELDGQEEQPART
jgi:hypothetical protein